VSLNPEQRLEARVSGRSALSCPARRAAPESGWHRDVGEEGQRVLVDAAPPLKATSRWVGWWESSAWQTRLTTMGSNWVPAQRRSSAVAAAWLIALR
jgi:hypothetical protein